MAWRRAVARIPVIVLGTVFIFATARSALADDALSAHASERQRAVTFLKALPGEWSGSSTKDCKTYEGKNIERLTQPFAIAAANFLKAFVEVHGQVTITSAHRTLVEQACVCLGEKGPCAGKPRIVKTKRGRRIVKRGGVSRHQSGIALDVRAGTGSDDEFKCLQEFASLNPELGIHFPFGKKDRPHMEPVYSKAAIVRVAALGSLRSSTIPCTNMRTMLTWDPVD